MRFVGGEHFSCELQIALNIRCGRVRAAKHAPRHPFRLLERRHGLADIVERGAGVAYATTGPSTFQGSSATGPSRAWCVVSDLQYASSTPLLGDAARRRRRSWPVRAANIFSECYPVGWPGAFECYTGGWPGALDLCMDLLLVVR